MNDMFHINNEIDLLNKTTLYEFLLRIFIIYYIVYLYDISRYISKIKTVCAFN